MLAHSGRSLAIATVVTFIIMFLLEWLIHGVALMPIYEATANLWRSPAAMEDLFGFCLMRKLLQSGVFAWLFVRLYTGGGVPQGIKMGLWLGLLVGLAAFGSYVYMPIPLQLALGWLAANVLVGVVSGLVLALIFRDCTCPAMHSSPKV